MSLSASMLEAMFAAGCTPEQIIAAARAQEQDILASSVRQREAATARKRLQREREAAIRDDVTHVTHVTRDTPSPFEVPPAPLPTNPNPIPPSPPKGGSSPAELAGFWALYPNKVGKADAAKALAKALTRASFATIMAGLTRYVAKTDDRPWCNPATWLNQDRWTDEPVAVARGSPRRTDPKTAADFLFTETMDHLNGNLRQSGPQAVDWPDAGEFPGITISGPARRLGIPRDG